MCPNDVCAQQTKTSLATLRPLTDVLTEIKCEKCVSFLYEPTLISEARVASTFHLKGDVNEILNRLLPPLDLKYKRVGQENYIILSKVSPSSPENVEDTRLYASKIGVPKGSSLVKKN